MQIQKLSLKLGPSYTIHVHGISANGTLGKATTSKDTIQLVVNAPTPTPTQTPTQTPTPTPNQNPLQLLLIAPVLQMEMKKSQSHHRILNRTE